MPAFMKMKILHEKAVAAAQTYLKSERDLISLLQEIDRCQGYREYQHKNLYDYARVELKLSDNTAWTLVSISKKSVEVPELKNLLVKEELTISNARMIVPVLTSENQTQWLEAAKTLSKRELEKAIKKEFPEKCVKDRARYVAEERMELKVGISEKLLQKLKRIQDLESKKGAATLEQALEAMADLYLSKNDPLEKAKRAKPFVPGRESKNPRQFPAQIKHAVNQEHQAQCTHIKNGERCTERRWLDIHHKKPVSKGGETTQQNLTLLCRGHHQLLHARS
jgi:hypothetical protein